MTPLFIYLLKVNIALILFYLAYRYGLRKLTFYSLNRFFLLFGIVFSSAYPLIDVNSLLREQADTAPQVIYYLDLSSLAQEADLGIWNLLTVVFWSGVAIMTTRFLIQLGSLLYIHFSSRKQRLGQQPVRLVKEKINPFSFFRNIYLNPSLHTHAELNSILEHEKIHVKEWHTADILTGELNRIFYWFNPGAWLMMTAIRENLEFITDRKVLQSGIDAKAYQYSLINVSNIPHASPLANNFNFSHLKIRITMMDKKRSSELHLLKYLVLLPFVTALALVFNISRAGEHNAAEDMNRIISSVLPAADTIPASDTISGRVAGAVLPATDMIPEKEIPPPPPAVKQVKFTPPKKDTAVTQVKFYPPKNAKDTTGKENKGKTVFLTWSIGKTVKPARERDTSVVPAKTSIGITMNDTSKAPLYIIDGNPVKGNVSGMDPGKIASVQVLKGHQATSLYGRKGENGVIMIVTKANAADSLDKAIQKNIKIEMDKALEKEKNPEVNNKGQNVSIKGLNAATPPLILMDGKEISPDEIEKLSEEDKIKSIEVIKTPDKLLEYGEKGKNGVIIIKTK